MRHSERGRFNTCPYAYHLEQEGWRPLELTEKAEDRTFGIAIHDALKVFYDTGSLEGALNKYSELYPFKKEYKSKAKDYESGLQLLKNYFLYWSVSDKQWDVLATELADKSVFNDEEHELHIDLVARNKQTGEVWGWDHKVTEKFAGKGFFKKYEIDAQVTRYTAYLQDKYGACGGFLINAMQVGHRERKYKEEPAGYYQKFDRQPFSRTPKQIEFWKRSEGEWQRMIEFCEKESVWPKHLSSLCGWCDYYALCLASGDETVRESLYTTDPLQVAEEFNVVDDTGDARRG